MSHAERSPHPEFRLFSNNHSKCRNLICVGRIHFHGQSLFIYRNEEAAEEERVEEEEQENSEGEEAGGRRKIRGREKGEEEEAAKEPSSQSCLLPATHNGNQSGPADNVRHC